MGGVWILASFGGYSQLTAVPWLIKVFTPRVGGAAEQDTGLVVMWDCGSHGRSA